jgi:beta-N-acetylhexosaminidase
MEIHGKVIAAGVAFAITAGAVVHHLAPKGTDRVLSTVATKTVDALPSAILPDSTTSTTEAATACIDIATVALPTKIGALLIPMATTQEFDLLAHTLVTDQISSFTLLGLLPDSVQFNGLSMSLAVATNSLIQKTRDSTGVKVTFPLDEEGGKVQRTKGIDNGAHVLPSPEIQATLGPAKIAELFIKHGQFLATLGVTTDFGPLIDVGTDGADGTRSYSNDPNIMAVSAGAAIDGLHAAGLQATVKHLPDNGRDKNNTDTATGVVPDINTLLTSTLPAITSVLSTHHPDYGMVGNYSVPGLTGNEPASMSKATYDFIHTQMGYSGPLITDALNAVSIQSYNGAADLITSQAIASVQALEVGADIVIISLDASDAVVAAIHTALTTNSLSVSRLNAAAKASFSAKGYRIC